MIVLVTVKVVEVPESLVVVNSLAQIGTVVVVVRMVKSIRYAEVTRLITLNQCYLAFFLMRNHIFPVSTTQSQNSPSPLTHPPTYSTEKNITLEGLTYSWVYIYREGR